MRPERPTNKQREILSLVAQMIQANGHSPSFAEIAAVLKIQPSAVHYRLRVLMEKDWVTWIARKPRTIRITEKGAPHVRGV